MLGRPKTSNRDLPPRMLRRVRYRAGKELVYFYYATTSESGKRTEILLGKDLHQAKLKWAQLEQADRPKLPGSFVSTLERYYKHEDFTNQMPRTQRDYQRYAGNLLKKFAEMDIDDIRPHHVREYLDDRGQQSKTGANREVTLLSIVYNFALAYQLATHDNPVAGIRKYKEKPLEKETGDDVWLAVYEAAVPELKDAMDIAYLTGARPADVLGFKSSDVRDGKLYMQAQKTGKRSELMVTEALQGVLDRIAAKHGPMGPQDADNVYPLVCVVKPRGRLALTDQMLKGRMDDARKAAAAAHPDIAQRVLSFQFRFNRAKAARDTDSAHATRLLQHNNERFTEARYGNGARPVAALNRRISK